MEEELPAADTAWTPEDASVLCVTADPVLLEECARVAAVAGVRLEGFSQFDDASRSWADRLLLLGSDVGDVPPRLRGDLVLVGHSAGRERLWARAAELGVEHVAELPAAAGWLVDFLGRRHPLAEEGTVLGVLGGCGGAGASTTAALLAAAAALRGHGTVLVDGDRLGGGLELCVAEDSPPGLSWPDLAAASGSINPAQLEASLPSLQGLAFLSWPAGTGPAGQVGSAAIAGVLEAARRAYELVVVDVGRGREAIEDFGWACERTLVVVPGRLRAALAAARVAHELPPVPTGVLVRGPIAEGVDAERLAEVVGCPFAAKLPELRSAPRAAESGRLLELARDRRVRRMADGVLAAVLERPDAGPPDLAQRGPRRSGRTHPARGAA